MPTNVKNNEDATMGRKMNEIVTKEEDHVKKKIGRISISN